MGKRRSDADHRRFLDEFLCVKIPRLRATGVVQLDAPHTIIQVGDRQKLIGLAHVRFGTGGSRSLFRCPQCARRANRLWLVEDRPLCARCCNGLNIWHRTKWGFGRRERLKAKDKALIASRRRAHPVRRSWAAGHRLRAMRRTWARWRDEARGAACRRQTHQSPSDALCWRGKLLLLTDRGSSLRLPNHAKVRQGSPNMTEEMSPQVLLTATGFAAGEALAVLRKHNIATAAFFRPPSIGACRKPVRRSTTIAGRSWSRSSTGSTPKTAPRSCALGRTRVERRRDGPFAWESSRTPVISAAMKRPASLSRGSSSCICASGSPTPIGCSRTKSGRC